MSLAAPLATISSPADISRVILVDLELSSRSTACCSLRVSPGASIEQPMRRTATGSQENLIMLCISITHSPAGFVNEVSSISTLCLTSVTVAVIVWTGLVDLVI